MKSALPSLLDGIDELLRYALVLFLFLWWKAPEGAEDIPFMGY
jgi:hypothetical protein